MTTEQKLAAGWVDPSEPTEIGNNRYYSVDRRCTNCSRTSFSRHLCGFIAPYGVTCPFCETECARRL